MKLMVVFDAKTYDTKKMYISNRNNKTLTEIKYVA